MSVDLTEPDALRRLASGPRDLAKIVKAAERLPGRWRKYPASTTMFRILEIDALDGSMKIARRIRGHGTARSRTSTATISAGMLAAAADSLVAGQPVDMDQILKGAHNTRSALEAILVLLVPECHLCRIPGSGQRPRKHLVYLPDRKHRLGRVSEVPWEDLERPLPAGLENCPPRSSGPPSSKREHLSVQAMLVFIGRRLGFDVCIARNDLSSVVGGKPLSRHRGVKPHAAVAPFAGRPLPEKADLVDVIWCCRGRRLVAAMFEVESTTGVESGLTRMRCVLESPGSPRTKRHVVVVSPKDVARATRYVNRTDYLKLDARVLTTDSLRWLHALCSRGPMVGITSNFLDNFLDRRLKD